ncbi:unnamed protein product [Rotaria sp. Silwood2]|nr:unnamed protein product [Rotaria sp. Silwood2]
MIKYGRSQGYGFACFNTADEAKEAIDDSFSQNGRTSSTASSSSRLSPTINSPFNDHQFPYNIRENSKAGRQCSQSNSSSAELNQTINHQKSTSSNDENEENKSELSKQIYVDVRVFCIDSQFLFLK